MRVRVWLPIAVVVAVALALGIAFPSHADRNSSGTFSLPAGNPVVNNTTITPSWANTTMSDVGTNLTESLSRTGQGAMLAPLQCTDGTVALPSLTFATDLDTGWYRAAANTPALSAGNTQVISCTTTGCTFPLGAVFTQSQTNADGVTVTGNGVNSGTHSVGGATSGNGVHGVGGAPNGIGVRGTGTGTGTGGTFASGTAATSGARRAAVTLTNGDIDFTAVTDADPLTAVSDLLTSSNIVKLWGNVSLNQATAPIQDGFNLGGVPSCAGGQLTVLIDADMANDDYAVKANYEGTVYVYAASTTPSQFVLAAWDLTTGASYDMCAIGSVGGIVSFSLIGNQ